MYESDILVGIMLEFRLYAFNERAQAVFNLGRTEHGGISRSVYIIPVSVKYLTAYVAHAATVHAHVEDAKAGAGPQRDRVRKG